MIGFNQILDLILWLTNAHSNFVPMFLFISMLFSNIHNSIVNTRKQWKLGRNMLIRWYVPQSLCIFTEEIKEISFIKEMDKFSRVDFTLQNTGKYWNIYKHGNEKSYSTECNQILDNRILNLTIQSTNFVSMLLYTSMLLSIVLNIITNTRKLWGG